MKKFAAVFILSIIEEILITCLITMTIFFGLPAIMMIGIVILFKTYRSISKGV